MSYVCRSHSFAVRPPQAIVYTGGAAEACGGKPYLYSGTCPTDLSTPPAYNLLRRGGEKAPSMNEDAKAGPTRPPLRPRPVIRPHVGKLGGSSSVYGIAEPGSASEDDARAQADLRRGGVPGAGIPRGRVLLCPLKGAGTAAATEGAERPPLADKSARAGPQLSVRLGVRWRAVGHSQGRKRAPS